MLKNSGEYCYLLRFIILIILFQISVFDKQNEVVFNSFEPKLKILIKLSVTHASDILPVSQCGKISQTAPEYLPWNQQWPSKSLSLWLLWSKRVKQLLRILIREGFKKSKWKFKMAFAMKGGGGSRGGLECHLPILKNDFFKNHLESFPDCENVFCT